MKVCIKQHPA